MKNKKGFTLIELLGIITIIAVIMVIAVPQIIKIFSNSTDNTWNNSVNGIENALSKNIQVVNPITGKYKYTVEEFCSNPSKLDEIVDYKNIDITCKDNTFTLKGNGQLKDRTAIIECGNLQCDLLKQNSDGTQIAGLYDKDDNMIISWNLFTKETGFNVEKNYVGDLYYLMDDGTWRSWFHMNADGLGSGYGNYYHGAVVDVNSVSETALVKILSNQKYKDVTKIVLPSGIKKIGNGSFSGTKVTEIVLPDSITNIGTYAFAACTNIENIDIPRGVTALGNSAFYHCDALKSISLYNNDISILDMSIFGSCINLSEVILPKNLTKIRQSAFSGCKNLGNIEIPDTVKEIETNAFYECEKLTNVTLPNGLTKLGTAVFSESSISSIKIPRSVVTIGSNPFSNCKLLKNIIVDKDNKYYDSREDCNCIIEKSSNKLVSGSINSIIPSGVQTIGDSAFYVVPIQNATVPNTVTTIEKHAFYGSNLENITIPSSVTSIGYDAFPSKLKEAVFENPNGWAGKKYSSPYDTVEFSATDLANSTTAAEYLSDFRKYQFYNWTRSN